MLQELGSSCYLVVGKWSCSTARRHSDAISNVFFCVKVKPAEQAVRPKQAMHEAQSCLLDDQWSFSVDMNGTIFITYKWLHVKAKG